MPFRDRLQTCSTRGKRKFHLRATYGMDQKIIDALKNQRWSMVCWSIYGTCPRHPGNCIRIPTSRRIEKSIVNQTVAE